MNKKYIIIGLSILTILLVIVVVLIPLDTSPTNTPNVNSTPSLFPLEKVKSLISNIPIIKEVTEQVDTILPTETVTTKILTKIISEPVVDLGFINMGTSTYPYFLSKEGYIKVLEADGTKLLYGNKIENLKSGFLTTDNNNYYFYLKTNSLFNQLIIPKTSSSTPKISNLNPNILDLIPTLDNKVLVLETLDNGSIIKLFNSNLTNQQTIWSNPLKEWAILPGTNSVTIQTKPSSGINGYLYNLNINNLKTTEILSGVSGLMSKTSPNGIYTLATESKNGKITTLIYENKADGDVYETSFNTIPDKCEWIDSRLLICANPTNLGNYSYPDDWYQGQIKFKDNFWILETDKKIAHLLINTDHNNYIEDVDAINLKVSPDKSKLYFINKIDSTLWSLDLTGFEF